MPSLSVALTQLNEPLEEKNMQNILIQGDALEPSGTDLIAQIRQLAVGQPVPHGWRVLSGNTSYSSIARVCYRYEVQTL